MTMVLWFKKKDGKNCVLFVFYFNLDKQKKLEELFLEWSVQKDLSKGENPFPCLKHKKESF